MEKNKWTRKYNLRQRKKLQVGEFQVMVFVAKAKLSKALSAEESEAWMDAFITSAIEANGLVCAGGLNEDFWCYALADQERQSVTEAQRVAVRDWLASRTELNDLRVSELRDANLGLEDF
ncbi:MAG: 50S ribosome-binding protein YggL [Pseudomonadota bacterium]